MSVIAFDGNTFAADGRSLSGWTITSDKVEKIIRVSDSIFCGYVGETRYQRDLFNWVRNGMEQEFPIASEFDGSLIVIDKNEKTITEYCGSKHPIVEDMAPYSEHAWGSGSDMALAAMGVGSSAEEAVRLVIGLNASCGGKVRTLQVFE